MKLRYSAGTEVLTQTAEPCGIMNDTLYFTDTECFSFVAAGQCSVLQLCPGDIILT